MYDLHSECYVLPVLDFDDYGADNTPDAIPLELSTVVDAEDDPVEYTSKLRFNAAELLLYVGVGGITFTTNNKIEFKLTHSFDDDTYVAVTAADVLGVASVGSGGIIKSLTAAHAEAAWYRFGYIGDRNYLKLLADFSGSHASDTPLAAVLLLAKPTAAPTPNQR